MIGIYHRAASNRPAYHALQHRYIPPTSLLLFLFAASPSLIILPLPFSANEAPARATSTSAHFSLWRVIGVVDLHTGDDDGLPRLVESEVLSDARDIPDPAPGGRDRVGRGARHGGKSDLLWLDSLCVASMVVASV